MGYSILDSFARHRQTKIGKFQKDPTSSLWQTLNLVRWAFPLIKRLRNTQMELFYLGQDFV